MVADPRRAPLDATPLLGWGAQIVAIAGWGKSLIDRPDVALFACGLAYSAALWAMAWARSAHVRRWSSAVAVAALLGLIAVSANAALLTFVAVVPLLALAQGLRRAAQVVGAVVVVSALTSAAAGEPWTDVAQYMISTAGGGVFVLAFARSLMQEQHDRIALTEQAGRIAELSAIVERNRVAQAMHDGVGHYLSAAVVQLEASRLARARAPEQADASLERAGELITAGMREIRHAVSVLRDAGPSSFDLALAELVAASEEAGLRTLLTRRGTPRRLAPDAAWAIYHSMQEALTNIRVHARASRVEIDLAYGEDYVELEVSDDGVGCPDPVAGNGLCGIVERAEQWAGTASFGGRDGGGFGVTLRIRA